MHKNSYRIMWTGEKKATNLAPAYVYLNMFKNIINYMMKLGVGN